MTTQKQKDICTELLLLEIKAKNEKFKGNRYSPITRDDSLLVDDSKLLGTRESSGGKKVVCVGPVSVVNGIYLPLGFQWYQRS